jgi:DNA-binding response OmpR family regulator
VLRFGLEKSSQQLNIPEWLGPRNFKHFGQEGIVMTGTKKIIIVDDDDLLRDTLKEQFSLHDEFHVTEAATASAGIKLLKAEHADLVILDVNLPDMDGREACKVMRRGGYKGPVIMLTAQTSESDTILGLDSGANDYVTKPFRFAVLLARIRAHLRQHEHSEDAVFKVGPYTFKPSAKMLVRDDNRKVRLTEKETAIIKFLLRSGEQIVSRDVLLQDVWGYNAGVTTHTLETHVYRLRQKIERDPSHAEILVTEGGGYKLIP